MTTTDAWTHTSFGKQLDLTDPKPSDISILEIANALGQQCRYNGCTFGFYSVAEHSVLMRRYERNRRSRDLKHTLKVQLGCLLHDAAEAYMGDITWPVQQILFRGVGGEDCRSRYKALQKRLNSAICALLGVDPKILDLPEVHELDLRILMDERSQVLGPAHPDEARPYAFEGTPLNMEIYCWDPAKAGREWFKELRIVLDSLAAAGV